MPTESNEVNLGKLLYKNQEGIIKELCSYEYKEENNDTTGFISPTDFMKTYSKKRMTMLFIYQ